MGREIVMVRLTPEADESQLFFSLKLVWPCRDAETRIADGRCATRPKSAFSKSLARR